MTLKRRFSSWLFFCVVCFTLLAGISTYLSPHAQAAMQNPNLPPTCTGIACDGKGPGGTHCDSDANLVYIDSFYTSKGLLGFLDLWHSTACKTEWAQVILSGNGGYIYDVTIQRCPKQEHGQYNCSGGVDEGYTTTTNANATEAHTVMVYEPYMSANGFAHVENVWTDTGFY